MGKTQYGQIFTNFLFHSQFYMMSCSKWQTIFKTKAQWSQSVSIMWNLSKLGSVLWILGYILRPGRAVLVWKFSKGLMIYNSGKFTIKVLRKWHAQIQSVEKIWGYRSWQSKESCKIFKISLSGFLFLCSFGILETFSHFVRASAT